VAKIFGQSKKWTKTGLTWKFNNFTASGNLTQSEAETAFQKACDAWAAPTGLTFTQANANPSPDILVKWATIDSPGDKLAITSPIPDGQNKQITITFDTVEDWTGNRVILTAVNFFSVALHELGHAIGMDHSANQSAAMYPINLDFFVARSELTTDDKDGASYLYKNVSSSDGLQIMIVNEAQYSVSWFAFNDYDGWKWTGLSSGDLAGGEMYWYRPVTNSSGSYFIRFSHLGTKDYEFAGGIVKPQNNKVMISYQPVGTYGANVEVAYEN
jgi:hypothetical protein